jgi:hypothetical protein
VGNYIARSLSSFCRALIFRVCSEMSLLPLDNYGFGRSLRGFFGPFLSMSVLRLARLNRPFLSIRLEELEDGG